MSNDDELVFIAEDEPTKQPSLPEWKILIVDDETEVHNVTKLVLENFTFEERKLKILSAFSKSQAIEILSSNQDIVLVLLDVVMEEEDSGLQLVQFIREELRNDLIRIVLRTGQPGQAPEEEIILKYDINDYKAKTELTASRLYTTIITSLRTYNSLFELKNAKSELQAANLEAQKLNQIKNYFLRNLSHELRTPLNGIIGFADLLEEQVTDAELLSFIINIQNSGGRLMRILNDLMDLVEIETSENELKLEQVNVSNLIHSISEKAKASLKAKVNLTAKNMDKMVVIKTNENLLQKSLQHLIQNSCKFTFEGEIVIDVLNQSAGTVTVLIEDTGIGIEENFLPNIFEPFLQEDSENSRNFEGVGIGLSLVKKFLDTIQGTIEIDSEKGKGTRITLNLKSLDY